MNKVEVEWTGKYPCLCNGEWILKIDGVDYSDIVPFDGDANTYGVYNKCRFGKDWEEIWESYEDGMYYDEWIAENIEWLKELPNGVDYYEVYDSFNACDWRYGSCGGCI